MSDANRSPADHSPEQFSGLESSTGSMWCVMMVWLEWMGLYKWDSNRRKTTNHMFYEPLPLPPSMRGSPLIDADRKHVHSGGFQTLPKADEDNEFCCYCGFD